MFTLMLNGGLGLILAMGLMFADLVHWGWALFFGILAFVAGQGLMGYLFQRRVKVAMEGVQKIMLEGQKRMQHKMHLWQMRPPGSVKQAQLEMEREQAKVVEQALAASACLERFVGWVPLMERQIASLRVQLFWSLKQFKKVDELLPKVLFIEPMMIAMKIARLWMLDAEIGTIEKFFRKHVMKLRYGQGAVLYSLMAWIHLQRKDVEGALKILIEACGKMEHEVVKRNREHLANNRSNQFSNSGFGDEWYALHLEEPKVKVQRQSSFAQRRF